MKLIRLISISICFSLALPLWAAVMTSSNYSIQSDSVNFGGGLSSSTNYTQESTFGEVATGNSGSTNYKVHAGYQQMQSAYLSMSSISNVTLSPTIPTTGGGTADGSTSMTVTTDNSAGYELYIEASSSPALVSGANSFDDYTPSGADPDFTWSVASADSEFGFSPEGADVVQKFLDNGSTCNVGSSNTSDSCWSPLTTSQQAIAQSTSANYPSGTLTTLKFKAESGSSHVQASGTYTATTTVTAVAL